MDAALVHFQSHRYGVMLADGLAHEIRFIVDGRMGEVAFPADRGMLEAEELVLFVPRDQPADDHELQLLLGAKEVDGEATGLMDRWKAYHGVTEKPLFASCRIEAGKFDGAVIEVDELVAMSTVRSVEGRMLKKANRDKTRLRATCARAKAEIQNPVAVGADQYGIEVRAAFGIVRVFFAETAKDPADAERLLGMLLGDGT